MPRKLDDWINAYMQYTEMSEPPDSFRLWSAISTVASALQRKCFLQFGHITIYPNMFIVLVAPPGRCRKGTAMDPAVDLMEDVGIRLSAEATTREALIRFLQDSATTTTNLKESKISQHTSVTIASKELTVFLGYNELNLLTALTDWYDCKNHWTYDTKNKGTNFISNLWVNLIGATTPESLQSSLPKDAIGGGFTSRVIFIYEEERSKRIPLTIMPAVDQNLREALLNDLERILTISGKFCYSADFSDEFTTWYSRTSTKTDFRDPRLGGYHERKAVHILKLCMIMSASRGDELVITGKDFFRSLTVLEGAEKNMGKAFGGIGANQWAGVLHDVLAFFVRNKEVSRTTLQAYFVNDANADTLDLIMRTIIGMGRAELINKDGKTYYRYIPEPKDR